MRYAAIKNNIICFISNELYDNSDFQFIEIPIELSHISSRDLIVNSRIKGGKIISRLSKKPVKEMKVALVGNWKMACGLSTYSENLWPQIAKYVGDYKLFIEKNDNITGQLTQFGDQIISSDKISICWKRGESLKELIAQIKNYDPDIIIINHEFGLWPNAAYWMSMITQLSDYRLIVVMHSVFPRHKDKTIVEACIPEIVVHLEGAKKALIEEKGIYNKIYVIPHGCYPSSNERLWNFYKTEHTIIQMGFGFRYKNFEDTIMACSIVKEKYSDIFLTIIFSESDQNKNEHQIYYNELHQLIEKLSLEENVAIVRGFQSDTVVNSYLNTNRVVVLPYKSNFEHQVYGASGIGRLGMVAGIPVISSSIPHFSDLPTIKCDCSEKIAQELDNLFSNSSYYDEQVQKQNSFIKENSWENVALKFVKILEEDI